MKTIVMEHFNGILFHKSGPANEQHTNQPIAQHCVILRRNRIMARGAKKGEGSKYEKEEEHSWNDLSLSLEDGS